MGSTDDLTITIFALPGTASLAAAARAMGWDVRDDDGRPDVALRFVASGASIVIVSGEPAVAPLLLEAERRGAALLALASDTQAFEAIHDAGATHVVAATADAAELRQALRSAARHAERSAKCRTEDERDAAPMAAPTSEGAAVEHDGPQGPASIESLAIDLHHAIDRGEIAILYQPQVEIVSGRIVGVEALARWHHPRHGGLGAEELFAAAEQANLGIEVSDHIQRLVLAEAAAWPRALESLRVSLNLTAADFARPDFARAFLTIVDRSGFPRGRLTIEITETGLIEDLDAVSTLLAELRGAGCRVAIDDFGTGYSSLAYLKALPLDYLKIDKTMTRDIGGSARDRVVVRGVIAMARSLGFAVIAEGVETERQRELLAAEGCDFYQGFLRAEPLGLGALTAMMEGA